MGTLAEGGAQLEEVIASDAIQIGVKSAVDDAPELALVWCQDNTCTFIIFWLDAATYCSP